MSRNIRKITDSCDFCFNNAEYLVTQDVTGFFNKLLGSILGYNNWKFLVCKNHALWLYGDVNRFGVNLTDKYIEEYVRERTVHKRKKKANK